MLGGGFGHWNHHGGQHGENSEDDAGGSDKEKSKKTVRFEKDGNKKDKGPGKKPEKPKGKKRKRAKNND